MRVFSTFILTFVFFAFIGCGVNENTYFSNADSLVSAEMIKDYSSRWRSRKDDYNAELTASKILSASCGDSQLKWKRNWLYAFLKFDYSKADLNCYWTASMREKGFTNVDNFAIELQVKIVDTSLPPPAVVDVMLRQVYGTFVFDNDDRVVLESEGFERFDLVVHMKHRLGDFLKFRAVVPYSQTPDKKSSLVKTTFKLGSFDSVVPYLHNGSPTVKPYIRILRNPEQDGFLYGPLNTETWLGSLNISAN